MKCPNCNHRLPFMSFVLRESKCGNCHGKISFDVKFSVISAFLGFFVSILYAMDLFKIATIMFIIVGAVIAILMPFSVRCDIEKKDG